MITTSFMTFISTSLKSVVAVELTSQNAGQI